MKILLVEDNELNRDMLSRRLERKDFSVICAEDGQSGVDMAKTEKPDLILMDLSLPVLDGWNATKILKNKLSFGLFKLFRGYQITDIVPPFKQRCDQYFHVPIFPVPIFKFIYFSLSISYFNRC